MRKRFSIILAIVLSVVCLMPTMSSAYYYGLADESGICSDSEMTIIDTATKDLVKKDFQLEIFLVKESGDFDEQAALEKIVAEEAGPNGAIAYINVTSSEAAMISFGPAASTFTADVCDEICSIAEDKCASVGAFDACQSIVRNVENTVDGKALVSGNYYNPAVTDYAGYLTDSEAAEVESRLDSIREKYGMDVAVYTEDQMTSFSETASADDIYDYEFYGAGNEDSGIMLYLCKSDRKYWFTTHADGQKTFSDRDIDDLCELVVPYLKNNDYYGAFMAYADGAEDVLSGGRVSIPVESKNIPLVILEALGIGVLFGLIVAAVTTAARKREMDTALEAADADEYVKEGSMVLTGQRDIFLYSSVVRTKKPESDSSHSSSSGRSHGGGGGSF